MISIVDSNKGMLSATCIKGVEIVGMPVELQLLVSCRVNLGFLGVSMLHSPLLFANPPWGASWPHALARCNRSCCCQLPVFTLALSLTAMITYPGAAAMNPST